MDEHLRVTLLADAGEDELGFARRLSQFWTHLLRSEPQLYEQIYAEATQCESEQGRLTRSYQFVAEAADALEAQLRQHGWTWRPIDRDDAYTRYEAVAPDWMQIEH